MSANGLPWLYRLCLWVILPPGRWFWGGLIDGVERVPMSGPLLIASNHASFMDPWFLGGILPRRPVRFLIVHRWFNKSRLWRFFFRHNGAIPTEPGDPMGTIRKVVGHLRDGHAVCVFPEGRISHDGTIGKGHAGIGHMAALSGAPVLPVAVIGSFQTLPRTRRTPRRHPVSFRVGEPMRFPGSPKTDTEDREIREFAHAVMDRIRELHGKGQVAPPVKSP